MLCLYEACQLNISCHYDMSAFDRSPITHNFFWIKMTTVFNTFIKNDVQMQHPCKVNSEIEAYLKNSLEKWYQQPNSYYLKKF